MFGIVTVLISIYSTIIPHIEFQLSPLPPDNGVVITFDDGPHPTHTEEILDILREKKVKATFFIIGAHIKRDKKAIMREVREGHTIGGHSYFHKNFSKISEGEIAEEVLLTHLQLALLIGQYPRYFRFPYGADDTRIQKFYRGKIIGWNVDGYDWKGGNPKKLAEKIISQTKTGSIILLHDIKGDTVKALPLIIDGIRAKKLEFTPLPSLMSTSSSLKKNDIIFYSRTKTGVLHDHSMRKKPQIQSTEEILDPIIITEVAPW